MCIFDLGHIYTGLNWLIFLFRWETNIRHTCMELCGSHSLFFNTSFYFYFFTFQMAASVLMQRCKLYYSSFIPIELQGLRLSEELQQSDCFFSQFTDFCQEGSHVLNWLKTTRLPSVPRLMPSRLSPPFEWNTTTHSEAPIAGILDIMGLPLSFSFCTIVIWTSGL